VTVNGFGCDELISHGINGYLFEPRNASELAEKILEALKGPHLGDRARETIETRFNLKQASRRYMEIYQELLGAG
jgi:glycosyltransferase involved in cell wall biosynthesis